MELTHVPTMCPYCGVGCGLNFVVKKGQLVGIEPWKRHPVNEGKLCPKGFECDQFVRSADRLTKPLIKKDGKFVGVLWEEALDLVASKLKATRETYGPNSVAFQVSCRISNEETYLTSKLARVGSNKNNIDNCARMYHAPSVTGLALSFGSGAATNPILRKRTAR